MLFDCPKPTYTFFLIKPDAIRRDLLGSILTRLAGPGYRFHPLSKFKIARLELRQASRPLLEAHYAEHREFPFFGDLLDLMTSGPLAAGVLACCDGQAVPLLRLRMGPFALPGPETIRGVYMLPGARPMENLMHAADSDAAAVREAELWFGPGGLSPV